MTGPRTPAEFRCVARRALAAELALDPSVGDVIDEVVETIIRVYCGEQLAPTPCQLLAGRMVLEAVEEYLELHKNSFVPAWADIKVIDWPEL